MLMQPLACIAMGLLALVAALPLERNIAPSLEPRQDSMVAFFFGLVADLKLSLISKPNITSIAEPIETEFEMALRCPIPARRLLPLTALATGACPATGPAPRRLAAPQLAVVDGSLTVAATFIGKVGEQQAG
jgi:hypothetical protein